MKKLSMILIMLFLAFSQNTKAECKSTGIKMFDYAIPECARKMEKEEQERNKKFYKELIKKQKLAEEERKLEEMKEKQAKYDAELEQMKRDNPNFKKPPKDKPGEQKNPTELSRDDLIEYRQRQITKNR